MNRQTDTIEVDKATADKLKERAAELSMTVDEFLAAIASETGVVRVDPGEIAELDRRWAKVEAGARAVRNEEVVRWLETWGTPEFKPWHEQ
jgi:predicted transcriptional regulator